MPERPHIELSESDERMLHELAPDESQSGPEGIHNHVVHGEPASYEDALADLVASDRSPKTPEAKRIDELSLESKALYKHITETSADIGRRFLTLKGSTERVAIAEQSAALKQDFDRNVAEYQTGQLDEEELFVSMTKINQQLESLRERLLPNE